MFCVSLFFIVLRKLSARPKPQVSQEREGKNIIKTKSPATVLVLGAALTASTPPSAEVPCPVPLESPSLQAVPGFQQSPSPHRHCSVCTTLCISPKTPLPFPFLWLTRACSQLTEPWPSLPELEAPSSSPAGHCTEV